MTTSEEIQELANKKLPMKLGVRKELKRLPHHLNDGERVINLSSGLYDGKQGLIVLTDHRVIFTSEGIGSSRLEDFPYSRISSVQTSTSMTFGELTIYVSGNKAQIKQLIKDRAPEIGDYIRHRISDSANASAQPSPAPPASTTDPADELRKFASLRDDGIISEEEFQAKKRQVLGLQ